MGGDSEIQQLYKTDRNPVQEQRFQQLLKDQGLTTADIGGTGGNGANSSGLSDSGLAGASINKAITGQQQALTDKFNQNKSDITDFTTKYNAAVPGIISSTESKYAIPDQVSGVNALNSRIKDLQLNANNQGAGGFASGDQVDRALNTRYLPNFNTAITNLGTSETLANQEESNLIKPYDTEGSLLAGRIASEMTGFTSEQNNQLNALMSKLQIGEQLTAAEISAANALAVAKTNYQSAVDSINASNNKVESITAGNYVYDPATGQYKYLS